MTMLVWANGIDLECEVAGKSTNPAILLIMGLGAQLAHWPDALPALLAEAGFYVIRYDNRDAGLSSRLNKLGAPELGDILSGAAPPPYSLTDMAEDALGLMDSLCIYKAHVVGASMGGMIAQNLASRHPERVLTLTSIMSATGNPALPAAPPEIMGAVISPPPVGADQEGLINNWVDVYNLIGSPGYDYDCAAERDRFRRVVQRSSDRSGFNRQLAAMVASGDRREALKTITAPTLVIHGEADRVIPVDGARDTAAHIEGADLVIVPGMGHDLPPFAVDLVASEIVKLTQRATALA
jgi:pimeloyl-ACP methyl ester carboxylesterase